MSPDQPQKPIDSFVDLVRALGPQEPDNPVIAALRALRALADAPAPPAPPVIQDRWFNNGTIYIDGYTYERCRFDGCNLVTSMATFTFRDCYIDPVTCRFYFDGPALKIVRLFAQDLVMKGRLDYRPEEDGMYPRIVSPDGKFTLE